MRMRGQHTCKGVYARRVPLPGEREPPSARAFAPQVPGRINSCAGRAVVLPMILTCTAWSYWVFRGRVKADGYHP